VTLKTELQHAKEVAKLDPKWLRTWFWPLWLSLIAVTFAVAEGIAIVHKGDGGTLSERTRHWLGIEPGAQGTRGWWAALVAALVIFVIWFSGHLLHWWPWEG
jgi:hypothetical protein